MKVVSSLERFKNDIFFAIDKAHKSIVWIDSFDYGYIKNILDDLSSTNECYKILFWSNSTGKITDSSQKSCVDVKVMRQDEKARTVVSTETDVVNFTEALKWFTNMPKCTHLVLRVSENNFAEKESIPTLQDFVYLNNEKPTEERRTVILVAASHFEVNGLEHICERITVPLPDKEDINKELDRIRGRDNDGNKLYEYPFSASFKVNMQKNKTELIDALYGMNLYDIKELLRTIIAESPEQDELLHVFAKKDIDEENVTLPQLIKKRKKQIVRNSGLLEVIDIEDDGDVKFCDTIADINNLRNHIEKEKVLIMNEDYQQSKLQKPRGVLLVGAPGCGKSESAKAIASILDLPIYRLDIGRLLGHKYGQSENRFIEALRTADASAPCVLWIDEIEKAFAGAGNESENDDTLTHIVGHFLTWMQEHETMVYLVATANNISKMRPEMLRTGRWDKKFYLTRPSIPGCRMILYTLLTNKFKIDLKDSNGNIVKFKRDYNQDKTLHIKFDNKEADDFAKDLHGLSGAEISSMILEAMKEKYRKNEKPSSLSINDLKQYFIMNSKNDEKHFRENQMEKKIDIKIRDIRIRHLGAKIDDEEELRRLFREELNQEFSASKFESEGFEPASASPDL